MATEKPPTSQLMPPEITALLHELKKTGKIEIYREKYFYFKWVLNDLSNLEEIYEWMVYRLLTNRGIPEETATDGEMKQVTSLVKQILLTYLRSLESDVWIQQKYWNRIKDKFLKFMQQFFPNATIYQSLDGITPDINTLLNHIQNRLKLDLKDEYEWKTGRLKDAIIKSQGEPKDQYRLKLQYVTDIYNKTQASLKQFAESAKQLYSELDRKIYEHECSPYLCTISLYQLGGSDVIGVWRHGQMIIRISGDLDGRDETMSGILTRSFIYQSFRQKY
jgi:hypothetical protein